MLGRRQVIPDFLAIRKSMCPARCPKDTRPACTPGTSRPNPSLSYPGCPGPRPNWDSKPPPLSPGLRAVQGTPPQKKTLTVGMEKDRTHDKRATSLPSTHTQVCARDNKSMTCLDGLCNDRSLTDTDRESSVTKLCLVGRRTQPLTPTNTQPYPCPVKFFLFHHL